MKCQAAYSLLCSLYFINSLSIGTHESNTASFLNNQPAIVINSDTKEYVFRGEEWKKITLQDIDALPADLESVTFAFTRLKKIPEQLFEKISKVQRIEFIRNPSITSLPKSFYRLKHVKSLSIHIFFAIKTLPINFNSLESLTISIWDKSQSNKILKSVRNFQNLKALSFPRNGIKKLPDVMFDLKHLEKLDISANFLTEMDSRLLTLRNLKELDCSGNQLRSFSSIGLPLFKKLETINASSNKFASQFSGKKNPYDYLMYGAVHQTNTNDAYKYNLKRFFVSENRVEFSPDVFRGYSHVFQNLETLDMRDSKIRILPDFIYDLTHLKLLDVRENKLTDDIDKLHEMHIENLYV